MISFAFLILSIGVIFLVIISAQIFLKDKKKEEEIAQDFYELYLENYNSRLYKKALYYIKKAYKVCPERQEYKEKIDELYMLENEEKENNEDNNNDIYEEEKIAEKELKSNDVNDNSDNTNNDNIESNS